MPLKPWSRTATKTLHHTRVFDIEEHTHIHPDKNTSNNYIVLKAPDWANVIALTPERQLVVVRQFRFGTQELSWEIPGGIIDPGEDPVAAGLRELREETAYTAPSPKPLASIRPNPAFLSNTHHIVLAENATPDPRGTKWDHDEELEIKTIPLPEAYEWIRDGRIQHSLVIAALLYLKTYPQPRA